MRVVSASEPPTFPSTLMRSKGTSFRSRSATERTASTAISANLWCSFETLQGVMSQDDLRSWKGYKHFTSKTCHRNLEKI